MPSVNWIKPDCAMVMQGDFTMQCNRSAKDACLVKIRCHLARVVSVLQHFHRVSTDKTRAYKQKIESAPSMRPPIQRRAGEQHDVDEG
jgi:hypothetical protein